MPIGEGGSPSAPNQTDPDTASNSDDWRDATSGRGQLTAELPGRYRSNRASALALPRVLLALAPVIALLPGVVPFLPNLLGY